MSDAAERIGNGDREAAVAALKTHHSEGRLDSQEYEDRAFRAGQARTWADLDTLFTDLPEPRPAPGGTTSTAAGPSTGPEIVRAVPVGAAHPVSGGAGGLIPEPWARTAVAAAPIAAVLLFFITGSWLWFLAIPLVGIVVYGPGGHHGWH